MEFSYKPINPFQDDGLSDEDRLLIDAIRKTAYICGRRLDDIEYTVHQVLKQIGKTDLLPPCEQEVRENHSIKTVTNAKEAENYPISEDISKSIEEINKLLFENGQAESEDKE